MVGSIFIAQVRFLSRDERSSRSLISGKKQTGKGQSRGQKTHIADTGNYSIYIKGERLSMRIISPQKPLWLIIAGIILLGPFCCNVRAAENSPALFQEAEALFQKKRYADALRVYEKLIIQEPSFTQGYRGIARCYTALGDPQGAVVYMESLLLQNPSSADFCYGMGYALYNAKKYPEAKTYFEKAVSLNPDLAAAWNNSAAIYHFILKDYGKARTCYEKAISISKRTNNQWVLEVAQKNLANLPAAEAKKTVAEHLSMEQFINRLVEKVDAGDETAVEALVSGQRENAAQAMDWLLDEALRSSVDGRSDDEKTRLLLAALLAKEYAKSFKSQLLQKKLEAYQGTTAEQKKKIAAAQQQLKQGLRDEQSGKYEEAQQAYGGAAAAFSECRDNLRAGTALTCAGDLHRTMKNYPLARAAYSAALTSFSSAGDEAKQALVLSSLGITSFYLGEQDTALSFLNRSLSLYRAMHDTAAEQKVKQNIELVKTQRKQ